MTAAGEAATSRRGPGETRPDNPADLSTPVNLELFWSRVDRRSDASCWYWTGPTRHGYGRQGGLAAHRVAYELANGPIPDGLTVDHLCFVPRCVNPTHLRLLTLSENARNQRAAKKTHCINGHAYTPENTYWRPVRYREGRRDCRKCICERVKAYKLRRRGAVSA